MRKYLLALTCSVAFASAAPAAVFAQIAPTTGQPGRPGRPGRKPDQAAAAREREARRPELRGVLRTADWLDEATRWSA